CDGVYDTRLYNDRLLLGLKGTMSEAELHLLRLRMSAGRMTAVRRGAYRQYLPTALVRLPHGTVVKEPDQQVIHTIKLVFAKFEQLGSCRQVLLYLRRENILLPRRQRDGLYKGQILWKLPTEAAVLEILRSPAYAGAFVYGRRQAEASRQRADSRSTGRLRKPMDEWIHIQRDAYPAFITWEQYLANRERLRQNSTLFEQHGSRAQGAPREGEALLQGLATCGICGYIMRPNYKDKSSPRYDCRALPTRTGGRMCGSLHGTSIDAAVTQAFFEAIRPAQLDALEAVLATQQVERDRLSRQWQERLKRARYEAHLAERQYHAADPDHRLVTGELERRWEVALRELRSTEEDYERFERRPAQPALRPELREQLQHISAALPALWAGRQISNAQKKELLRALVSRVILKRIVQDKVEIKIVWVSGHYSIVHTRPPIRRDEDVSGYQAMVKRVRELWEEGMGIDEQIAAKLSAEGFHSARSAGVTPKTVQNIRLAHGWYHLLHQSRNALELRGHFTARGLAAQLGVERTWVLKRIYRGEISANYVKRCVHSQVWLIEKDPELIKYLQTLLPDRLRASRRHLDG
ncbi:MAG: recombinase family protein, partial [Acidobacteriota bacterium]|nr:recombinase family protein [Acidobacteriota bacterium]